LAFIIRTEHDARSSEYQTGKYCVPLRGKSVFHPEHRGNIQIRNVSNHIQNYLMSHTILFYCNDNIRNFPQTLVFSSRKVQGQIRENSRNNLLSPVVFNVKGNAL